MKRRWSLLLLLCLLLTGCSAEASGGQLISAAEGSESYSEALLPFLHGYALRDGEDMGRILSMRKYPRVMP